MIVIHPPPSPLHVQRQLEPTPSQKQFQPALIPIPTHMPRILFSLLVLRLLVSCDTVTHEEFYISNTKAREVAGLPGLTLEVAMNGTSDTLPEYAVSCSSPYALECQWHLQDSRSKPTSMITTRLHIPEIGFRWEITGRPEFVYHHGTVLKSKAVMSPKFEVDFERHLTHP